MIRHLFILALAGAFTFAVACGGSSEETAATDDGTETAGAEGEPMDEPMDEADPMEEAPMDEGAPMDDEGADEGDPLE